MITVNCVVVTYNRLALLKENLQALKAQTFQPQRIIIIDNCSTDDTAGFLETLKNDDQYLIIRTDKNIGGAGGFSLGLKTSVKYGCDFTWMMDDDTIPNADALERLVETTRQEKNVGFVCSRVNWTDGSQHTMNKPFLAYNDNFPTTSQVNHNTNTVKCLTCSFVSVLIASEAVRHVGLPIKEFFIWCDDIEYTQRISSAGFNCYYVAHSIVTHKTGSNYFPSIDKAPSNMAWRFYYQARNTCYIKRKKGKSKIVFLFSILNKYRVYKHKLNRRTDGHKEEFLKEVKRGCIDGLRFNPQIEYVD